MSIWQEQPDSNGWWLWRKNGTGRVEKILLSGNGAIVASDDEWEIATGRAAVSIAHHNYWEGTDTTQEFMPGLWKKDD